MQAIVIATLSIIPLVFLPLTQDMFVPIKFSVLVSGALLILLLWALGLATTGSANLSLSRASAGFGILAIAGFASLLIVSKARIEALLDPFGPATWVALTILITLGASSITHEMKRILSWTLLLVATTVAMLSILSHFQLLAALAPSLPFLASRSWTPIGNISLIPWIALACLPLLLVEGSLAWKRRDLILLLCVFLVAVSLVASASFYAVLPANERITLPFAEAWRIAAQSWSAPVQAIFGVGIENYLAAFSQGRSASLNSTPLWNIRFTMANELVLQIATTMGILGVIGLVFLARSLLNLTKGLLILALFLAPPSLPMLAIIAGVYLATTNDHYKTITIHIPSHLSWLRVETLILALGISAGGFYFAGRAFVSELTFMRSLEARGRSDGKATYELQIRVLELNPSITRFRIAYSQTNLDIANAIARQARPETQATASGQPLSEPDRQTISTLIQQAIREAKIAVSLSPTSPLAWENLARLYHGLTNVAQGADQWAFAAYQQTIAVDPTNPTIRVSYATLLRDLGDTDNAFIQFQNAAYLKSDYALAHYNLAQIYRSRQQYLLEARSLAQTLAAVTKGTDDESRVRAELETAKSNLSDGDRAQIDELLGVAPQTRGSELTSPLPETQTQLEPKIDLSSESSPGSLPRR